MSKKRPEGNELTNEVEEEGGDLPAPSVGKLAPAVVRIQKRYRFRMNVTYAPLGDTEYAAGQVDELTNWAREHVADALQAGLIEEV